ncbi:heavy-metal-associated domain-containing protein [Sphingobium sufflavum]|uniref:heavy-metal-associated domain-containing protein n=1 Tax=Sphingobium sufflavum TaxID=1129547 RepID=UPI001F2932F3|nr:heavy-metal-associated domain-containing protein [Sphingobium sufflavum]MCE7797424.1 heavy-metal-associated domain-containing protein [Sphingobium sufflavum]
MIRTLPAIRPVPIVASLLLAAAGAILIAQIEGERGIAPIASSADFEVRDIDVDVYGGTADSARVTGWKLAQRLAWRKLTQTTNGGAGGSLPDSALDSMVSAIEVQKEQIGPNRYIARLTVLFDRARAGQALGVSGQSMHSPPLLVLPVLTEGGTSAMFEYPTEWQRAWALFRTADSAIDYVRTSGAGADPMLLNAGQVTRRGRNWWRTLLDLYGAADVIMPLARIERLSPNGPVVGRFAARYGPDNRYIGGFTLRVEKPADIPAMMAQAVKRMDELYTQALISGVLRPDPSLVIEEPISNEAVDDAAQAAGITEYVPADTGPATGGTTTTYLIQYDTPNVGSVGQGETILRSIPGVRSATTTSLALGGTSVMQVAFGQSIEELRIALAARGYTVQGSGTTLRIVRRTAAPAGELE